MNQKTSRKSSLLTLAPLLLVIVIAVKSNPFTAIMEAGPSAYYQARMGLLRGTSVQKEKIAKVMEDGKISQDEYSEIVFPIYIKTAPSGVSVFPESEKAKSIDQLRAELVSQLPAH